jgi:uncharacterized membrane protein
MKNPNALGGEARGRIGSGPREVAMTTTQRQWAYIILAGITGAARDHLIARALQQTSMGLAVAA